MSLKPGKIIVAEKGILIVASHLINARDLLVHPEKGFTQIMLEFIYIEDKNKLVLSKLYHPKINNQNILDYFENSISNIKSFAIEFIKLIKL